MPTRRHSTCSDRPSTTWSGATPAPGSSTSRSEAWSTRCSRSSAPAGAGPATWRCSAAATASPPWPRRGRPGNHDVEGGALLLAEAPSEFAPTGPGSEGDDGAVAPAPLGRRLRRLTSVTHELLAAETVEEVAGIVTDHMMNAAGATVASISLVVDDHTLALIGIRGGREGVASRWATYGLDSNTPAAESARTGQPLYVDREEFARRYPDLEAAGPGNRSILCLPLVVSAGRVLGVVSLSFPGRRQIDEAEHLFLRLLADTCAMTIDRIEAQRSGGRPRGQAELPGRGEREAVQRPRLRGDADRGGRGGGALVRRLVRDLARGGRPAAQRRGRAHPPRADRAGRGAAGEVPRTTRRPTRAATACSAPGRASWCPRSATSCSSRPPGTRSTCG